MKRKISDIRRDYAYAMGDYACEIFTGDYLCAVGVGVSYACTMGFEGDYKCTVDVGGSYLSVMSVEGNNTCANLDVLFYF